MTVTESRKRVLGLVAAGVHSGNLPKAYFDAFPHYRKVAKDLLWEGFLQNAGRRGDELELTAAGRCLWSQAASAA